jgi:PiT family inorganic phosphate transporter
VSMMILVVLVTGALVAFVNGANDVSKGVATLVGSGLATPRRALAWGAGWTAVGGAAGALFAGAMVTTFGKGLLEAHVVPSFAAALASVLGAAAWVLLATRTGLPVSTTHAIVGSVCGAASVAYGMGGVRWGALAGRIALPLVVGPVVSLALTALVVVVVTRLTAGREAPEDGGGRGDARAAAGDGLADCVCVEPAAVLVLADGAMPGQTKLALSVPLFTVDTTAACAVDRPAAARVTLDHVHWATSAATSAARAMNDAPKMAALIVAAGALAGTAGGVPTRAAFAVVTVAMVFGSVVAGGRVLTMMSTKLTQMNHWEGFAANAVTASLVAAGAIFGLPLSTTHVATGGIVGSALHRGKGAIRGRTLRDMLLAWVVTLPGSALLGILAYFVVRLFVR